MKTRVAVVDSPGSPIQVRELTLAPPRAGEVLVEVHAAGICRSDWQVCTGATPHPLPAALGHEGAGVVLDTGPDVFHVSPGDPVILSWAPACSACFYCARSRPALCEHFNATIWKGVLSEGTPRLFDRGTPVYQYCALGCFAERIVVDGAACIPLQSGVPMEVAALIGCCVTTGVGAVLNTADVGPGDTVAVFGAGGVGLSVILGARLAKASRIIVVDKVPARGQFAEDLGATHFVPASSKTVDKIRELTGGRGADHVFDATGIPAAQEQCLEATRPGGTVVLVGLAPVGSQSNLPGAVITRQEKTIMGSYYGSAVPERDFAQYANWYMEGRLNLDPLLDRTYALDEISQAYEDLITGTIIRGMVSLAVQPLD